MWALRIYYDFDKFIDFLHRPTFNLTSGAICKPIFTHIEINQGYYSVSFELVPLQQQLKLF